MATKKTSQKLDRAQPSLPAKFSVGTYITMPKTVFADTLAQTSTHLVLTVGKETLKVRLEDVLCVRPRDVKSFRAVNPHLATGATDNFFDVLFNQRTLTAKFNASSVDKKPNKQGFVTVTDVFGGVSFHSPASFYCEPFASGL